MIDLKKPISTYFIIAVMCALFSPKAKGDSAVTIPQGDDAIESPNEADSSTSDSSSEADFWSQIDSVDAGAALRSPEAYLQAIREAIDLERWDEADSLCMSLIQQHPQLPKTLQEIAFQFWFRCLLAPKQLPAERVEAALLQLDAKDGFANEAIWNQGIRLLLRRIVTAETPQAKISRWREGLKRYTPPAAEFKIFDTTLAELDQFIALPESDRVVEPVAALDSLLAMGLDVSTQRQLIQRKVAYLREVGPLDQAIDAAWTQLIFHLSPDGEPVSILDQYEVLLRDNGNSPAQQILIEPRVSGASGWDKGGRIETLQAASPIRSNDLYRQQVWLSLLHGHTNEGIVAGQKSLVTAPVEKLWLNFDTLGMLAVRGTRDLRMASEPLRWHLHRVISIPIPLGEGGDLHLKEGAADSDHQEQGLALRLNDSWNQAISSAPEAPDAWISQSRYVQLLVLRNQLQRRSDTAVVWAVTALETGRPELSALFWGQALTDATLADNPEDPDSELLQRVVNNLATTLRGLNDPDTAVTMIGRVDRELKNPATRAPVLFLGATLLYEQGRMEDCLLALDRVESLNPSWDDSQKLAAGLIRAVAQLKLGRLEDAESVLVDTANFNGENEVMAQVAFLRGWIHLNRNDNTAALERFRDLVATYPTTRYAAQTRELIRRLETRTAAPASP